MNPVQFQIKEYIIKALDEAFEERYTVMHRGMEIDIFGLGYVAFTIDYSGDNVIGYTDARKKHVIFEVNRLKTLKDIITHVIKSS